MSTKGTTKLIAFVLAYTVVAFVIIAVLMVWDDAELAWQPHLYLSFFVALVTGVLDQRGKVAGTMLKAAQLLVVPVTLGWLYLAYRGLTATPREYGPIWFPLVCLVLFVGPSMIGRSRRKRKGK